MSDIVPVGSGATAAKLDGSERLAGTDSTVLDFWRWSTSDLMSNATRGVLAEYLVAVALGVDDQPRIEWDAVDLRYEGRGIEVKSAAHHQSWPQARPLGQSSLRTIVPSGSRP